jgi:PAS domain S-box-containing protein
MFLIVSTVGLVVVLTAWWLIERSWFGPMTQEEHLSLNALRGALATLLLIWMVLVVVQRRRRVAEEAEARLRGILDSAPDSIVILDSNGRIALLNTQTERMFGHDRAALLGRPVERLVPDRLPDEVRACLDQAAATPAPVPVPVPAPETRELELVGRHRDGSELFLEARLAVIRTGDHTVVTCILRDIGERRRAAEALHKQTEILKLILDSMADPVVVADQDERFLVFNPAAERMFGIGRTNTTADEWSQQYGLYQTDQVTPYPADDLPLRRATRGEEVNDVEIFVRNPKAPDGFWIVVNCRPLRDAQGGLRGGVAICRDITEQRRADRALRLSADELARTNAHLMQLTADLEELGMSRQKAYHELERAYHDLKQAEAQLIQAEKLSALGQLIAGVAHEINNPLAFVANNIAILRRDAQSLRDLVQIHQRGMDTLAAHHPELHAQINELCDRIDLDYTLDGLEKLLGRSGDGLRRIQQIVRDLRDFARLDETARMLVDLNEGIRSTVNIIAGYAKRQGVALTVDLGPVAPLLCYPGKVNQVVMNLLSNAIDACPPGGQGRVTLRTCEAERSGPRSRPGVEIHVIDNGHGIDPAIRSQIFDPFFTTKPVGQGTGLGLSISAGIVHAHQGRIDLQSSPGQGTHFTVFLPRTCIEAPPAEAAPVPLSTAGPLAGDA